MVWAVFGSSMFAYCSRGGRPLLCTGPSRHSMNTCFRETLEDSFGEQQQLIGMKVEIGRKPQTGTRSSNSPIKRRDVSVELVPRRALNLYLGVHLFHSLPE